MGSSLGQIITRASIRLFLGKATMDITDLLTELRGLGVSISFENDDLRLKAPKGTLTAELRSELSARKPEIIAFLRKAKAAAHQLPPSLVPGPRPERIPLSFAQQRLWFLDQWEPGNPELNIPGALSLSGTLDVSILQKTLQRIVERHESLRTTFGAEDGKPFQTIEDAVPVWPKTANPSRPSKMQYPYRCRWWILKPIPILTGSPPYKNCLPGPCTTGLI
jgi:hypothetical protein